MDDDLEQMTHEQLLEHTKALRRGMRAHRDRTGHELCWHHPALWSLLPERSDPLPIVPSWPERHASGTQTDTRLLRCTIRPR